MVRRLLVVVGLVALVTAGVLGVSGAGGAAGSMQTRWVITDLGTLGGKESEAVAINERGQIAGWSDTKSGNSHAFLWQRRKMTDLGSLTGNSGAGDINERGQVVGASESRVKDTDGDPIWHALLWQNGRKLDLTPTAKLAPLACYGARDAEASGTCTANGDLVNERGWVLVSMTGTGENDSTNINRAFLWQNGMLIDLGALSDWTTDAKAINDRGQVVGSAQTEAKDKDDVPFTHAFLWQNGKMTDLGTLGGKASEAVAINKRGQIVGSSDTKSGNGHAFLWQRGKMTDLGSLAGASSAADINARGQIVGWSDTGAKTPYGDSIGHAFLWQNGKMTDLGTLGGKASDAVAINERGQIIGCGRYDADGECSQAFVWQNGKMTGLGTLPGGKKSEALAINEHNQIVGYSTTKTGQQHAVLWTLKPAG